ncbi:hypothetical protein EYR38_010302 [Pleurotus pulmonarius]|nr:hypothetical protein EYR38_010302 [Pleurotus pulmonarius]
MPPPVATEKVKTKSVSSQDIVIAVMGPTGAGKSTFISYACRKASKDLIGHNLESCTSKVQPIRITTGTHNVILVDTPGFDDTNMSDTRVLGMIADWLLETYNNQVKLAGIIYMHRISDNRMAGTPLKNLKMFAQLCGTGAAERVILVTTMWGRVKQDVGAKREDELKSKFWKDMIDKKAKVARFEASFESAWAIIGRVYEPLEREAVLLQEELADLQKKLSETGAGKTLYNTLQKQLDEEKRLLKELYDEAERQDNPALAADLKNQYEQVRQQLEVTFKEVESLKIPFGRRILQFFSFKRARSKELVVEGKVLLKTGAGEHVFGELQALVKGQQDTLHQLRASMKRHDDEVILNALREEYEGLRLQMEAAVQDTEALKLHRGKRLRRFFSSSRLGFSLAGSLKT